VDPRQHEAPSPTPDPPPTPAQHGARAYAGAFEAVLSILVGAGLGWWGDSALGTGPWLLLVGLGFGFATFIVRLMRLRAVVEAEAAEAARRQESD
jgi:F0F1-type ATP synthase assembly protein I